MELLYHELGPKYLYVIAWFWKLNTCSENIPFQDM